MKRKKVQRVTAGVLAAVMLSTSGLSGFSVDSLAQLENLGKTDKLWSSTWHYYCIDHIGIAAMALAQTTMYISVSLPPLVCPVQKRR